MVLFHRLTPSLLLICIYCLPNATLTTAQINIHVATKGHQIQYDVPMTDGSASNRSRSNYNSSTRLFHSRHIHVRQLPFKSPPEKAPSKAKRIKSQSPTQIPTRRSTPSPTRSPVTRSPIAKATNSPVIAPSDSNVTTISSFTELNFNANVIVDVTSSLDASEVEDVLRGAWEDISAKIVHSTANDLMLTLVIDEYGVTTTVKVVCEVEEGSNEICFQVQASVAGRSIESQKSRGRRILSTTEKIESTIENKGKVELESSISESCANDSSICTIGRKEYEISGVNQEQVDKKGGIPLFAIVGAGILGGLIVLHEGSRRVLIRRRRYNAPEGRIRVSFPIPVAPFEDEEVVEVAEIDEKW
mmetsp:Transcript_20626/g.31320  ORF Transcript_20626/g.31320 Transcript_20626/m.31320 type:complete len:359 (+) Transcript_20626:52-1128(+)